MKETIWSLGERINGSEMRFLLYLSKCPFWWLSSAIWCECGFACSGSFFDGSIWCHMVEYGSEWCHMVSTMMWVTIPSMLEVCRIVTSILFNLSYFTVSNIAIKDVYSESLSSSSELISYQISKSPCWVPRVYRLSIVDERSNMTIFMTHLLAHKISFQHPWSITFSFDHSLQSPYCSTTSVLQSEISEPSRADLQ